MHATVSTIFAGCERERGFLELRDALLVHYEMARKKKEVKWLRTAADCRPYGCADRDGGDSENEDEGHDDEWLVGSEDSGED